jgi:hypothetical protein
MLWPLGHKDAAPFQIVAPGIDIAHAQADLDGVDGVGLVAVMSLVDQPEITPSDTL